MSNAALKTNRTTKPTTYQCYISIFLEDGRILRSEKRLNSEIWCKLTPGGGYRERRRTVTMTCIAVKPSKTTDQTTYLYSLADCLSIYYDNNPNRRRTDGAIVYDTHDNRVL